MFQYDLGIKLPTSDSNILNSFLLLITLKGESKEFHV